MLTYSERELATVSVIAVLGESVEPMLRSHMDICRRLGMTQEQLDRALSIAATDTADYAVKDGFPKGNKTARRAELHGRGMACRIRVRSRLDGLHRRERDFRAGRSQQLAFASRRTDIALYLRRRPLSGKGKPVQVLRPGDVVRIAPNVVHWHVAAPNSEFTHIAIGPQQHKGGAVWYGPVTDEEYDK